jgi:hypothetical protein
MAADYCNTVTAIAMVSMLEGGAVTAAVMIDQDNHAVLKLLAIIISVFLGIFGFAFNVAMIGGSAANLESSIEDELTKGLLPKNKD